MDNLRKLDLNLLLTLEVLLREQNVTRAAQRLNLSQPSVSVQLAKLRESLNDPLLLPGPRGMRPTARAEALRGPLHQILQALEQVIAPPAPFDPATATHTWRIMASDYCEMTVMLPALGPLYAAAPGIRLAIEDNKTDQIARRLESGEADIAFHIKEECPSGLRSRRLFQERYVLVGRRDHPCLTGSLSLAQFCDLKFVIVSPNGGGFDGPTDRALTQHGLSRRVACSIQHFMFLSSVLQETDLAAVAPYRLVKNDAMLRLAELPFDIPGFEMMMLWHERSHRDPAHRWLREVIARMVGL